MCSSSRAPESVWLDRLERRLAAEASESESANLEDGDEALGRSTAERLYAAVGGEAHVDSARAAELARLLANLAERLDDDFCRALAKKADGFLRYLASDHEPARKRFDEAARLFSSLGAEVDYAATLSTSLHALSYLGRYDEAYAAAAEAREVFERCDERLRLARLDTNEGNILFRQERIDEAQDRYRSALRIFREFEAAPQDLSAAMHNVITCAIALHDFDGALEVYDELREYCAEHHLEPVAAQAEYNIAYLHYLRGDYERALELYRDARELAQKVGDRYHQALCDLDQAEMLLELNMRDEGGRLAAAALDAFEGLGLGYEAGKSVTFLAIASSQKGASMQALELLRQGRERFEREGNRAWVAIIDLYRAVILHDEKRPLEARNLALAALAFFETSSLVSRTLICELLLARIALLSEDVDEARARAGSALDRAAALDRPALEFRAQLVAAQVAEADGDRELAVRRLAAAAELLEDQRSHLRAEELKLAFLRDKNEVFEDLVWLTLAGTVTPADKAAVFLSIERAKSRTLADLVSFRAPLLPAASPGHSHLVDEMRRLRNELNWYYRQIDLQELRAASVERRQEGTAAAREAPGGHTASTRLKELYAGSRRRESELVASLADLRAADSEFGSLQTASVLELEEIRDAIPDDALLLEYFFARDTVFCCVLGRSFLEVVPLTTGTLVRERQQRLSFQLGKFRLGGEYAQKFADMLQRSVLEHLQALEEELVAPLRSHLVAEHLIIVPHGSLHGLPFHAFYDGKEHLIDRFSISYAPSANVYALCARKPPSSRKGSLVLGVPSANAPRIGDEAEAVGGILPEAKLFLGPEATEERLRDEGSRARLIHVATHGLVREDNPMFSAIELGRSRLTLFDLYGLELDADLVVLSGCSTGVNIVEGGDELIGLSRGLLYAGARSVVASLWDVHDESTVSLMSRFHRSLLDSRQPARALKRAMRDVRESHPHPYYWAPFVLIGQSVPGPASSAAPASTPA